MVFCYYAPPTKVAVIWMANQLFSLDEIQTALGEQFSLRSFRRWKTLYRLTRRVIQDPALYNPRGAVSRLSADDQTFMLELVRTEPGLFLDEIRARLYDQSGILLSESAIHRNLVDKIKITLKKANMVNIRKSLHAKYTWVYDMANVPVEFLVFTGVFVSIE
jgi:transposase